VDSKDGPPAPAANIFPPTSGPDAGPSGGLVASAKILSPTVCEIILPAAVG